MEIGKVPGIQLGLPGQVYTGGTKMSIDHNWATALSTETGEYMGFACTICGAVLMEKWCNTTSLKEMPLGYLSFVHHMSFRSDCGMFEVGDDDVREYRMDWKTGKLVIPKYIYEAKNVGSLSRL